MAERKNVTEPALGATPNATEPGHDRPAPNPERVVKATRDPRKRIRVYDHNTGAKLPYSVPETHLDKFPHLRETPSTKEAGK